MRALVAGTLVVIGLLLVPFATIGIWLQRQVLPNDEFTDLATEVIQTDAVREAFANRFLDELEGVEPRLSLGRIVLEPAVEEAIGTDQFERVFRVAVSDMHAQLERGDDQLSLNLDAMLPIVKDLVAEVNSSVADQIPSAAGLPSITVVREQDVPALWWGVEVTRNAAWAFPVLMVVALAAAVVVAPRRAQTLIGAGAGVAVVCLVFGLALRTGRDFLSDYVGSVIDERAFNAGYDVVTDSLVNQTLLLGLLGVIAAGVGVVWLLVANAAPRRRA
jgi:hypothetical protein